MKNKIFVIYSIIIIISLIICSIWIGLTKRDKSILIAENTNILKDENIIQKDWQDNGIFSNYYTQASQKLQTLTLDEKIGQLLLVRFSDENTIENLKKYKFGGYLFFEKDFKEKTEKQVKDRATQLQNASNIPLLMAVDEEGGTVVRISSNSSLTKSPFKSSMELYQLGGFDRIEQDTIEKSHILNNLGINLNLAPVVDISTNSKDYIYKRTLGKGAELTSIYAKVVINASKKTKVSYTLKHFPGYGNNKDTHSGVSIDNRSYEDIFNYDLSPFRAGIEAGAEAILVSHNTVINIDKNNPASLSLNIHNLLRNELGFTGIIITDDLDMQAVSNDDETAVKAILAENDLIITTDYKNSIESIRKALQEGRIKQSLIDKLAFRILAWKYYKGLM